jgi:hypothetical protein
VVGSSPNADTSPVSEVHTFKVRAVDSAGTSPLVRPSGIGRGVAEHSPNEDLAEVRVRLRYLKRNEMRSAVRVRSSALFSYWVCK